MDIQSERMTLSVAEAAKTLGISRPSLYSLLDRPGFPAFRVGRRVLISRAGLERWIEQEAEGQRGA